jgi:CheY-like chemotaxis protein
MNRARILVAEDDPASLEMVVVYLESQGYQVAVATDGNRALDLGCSGQIDLILLDLNMPLYGGVEVLHMLRKRYLLRPVKVIALTANTSHAVRSEVERAGIDSFLLKPVGLARLRDEIERVLALPHVERKHGLRAG